MKHLLLIIIFTVLAIPVWLLSQSKDTILIKEGVALPLQRGYGELIIAPNPVEAKLALGKWTEPKPDEKVTFPDGQVHKWKSISADEKGWFSDSVLRNCYIYTSIQLLSDQIMILESYGNEMVYINGSPRSGNPYCLKDEWESWEPRFDYSLIPVFMKKGKNEILFRCSRGRFKSKLYLPKQSVMFNARDITIPDFISGDAINSWGSIVIINCTNVNLNHLEISTMIGGVSYNTPVKLIPPLSLRKVPFKIVAPPQNEKGTTLVNLTLINNEENKRKIIDSTSLLFRIVNVNENHKETFISAIDSSVQYYGINPSSSNGDKKNALFLSLHGASVEAINQSGSYYPKTWGHIVAPTNRRPYGFNWEGWGRLDALEVLDLVMKKYSIDQSRVYLTGHSMGGHGTWHLGSLFPDKFAAIGPSAGWISFWTYRYRGQQVADTTQIRRMIRRATTPSETFEYINNFSQMGVYVLHGAADDNVPVEQSRSMVEKLKNIKSDFVYNEQPEMGHWWDISDEPGSDCVDWAPMFDYFARHAKPSKNQVREVKFVTANPAVSSKDQWLTIDAQIEQLKISSADFRYYPGKNKFIGITDNVARLAIDLDLGDEVKSPTVEIDGQKITDIKGPFPDNKLWLEKHSGNWKIAASPSKDMKGSHRYGTFQEAFRNNVIFVYGTGGSREENMWAFDKARYDAEKLWYQGNGSVEVIADIYFDFKTNINRNVILYGNKNSNKAWNDLLKNSPVEVGNGYIKFGKEKFKGNNLACIFVRPREGTENASVGVVSGTGIIGMKINNRLPYLNPGIGLPDCTIFNSDILSKGEEGIILTGFFGLDWSSETGEFVRKKQK